jgi:hypothetical protein
MRRTVLQMYMADLFSGYLVFGLTGGLVGIWMIDVKVINTLANTVS